MAESSYYPVLLRVGGRDVLVVGGGPIGQRKAEIMLEHGARVTLVSPEVTPSLEALAGAGRIRWIDRAFEERDLGGCDLVFCATGDRTVNRRVSESASRRRLPVNVVDVPELCSFFAPSVLRRGHLSVAVGTDGRCPSFSRWVRLRLEDVVGEAHGKALHILDRLRRRMHERVRDPDARKRVMDAVLALELPRMVRERGEDETERAAFEAADRHLGPT